MQKYWRVYTLINSTLRAMGWPYYLEVGAADGLNVRKIERHSEAVSLAKIPKDWVNWQWEMTPETYFGHAAFDHIGKYGVVFLREWNAENLENRVRMCYDLLMDNGMLILEGIDPEGIKNDAWKIAVGLKAQGINCGIVRGEYLTVYKTKDLTKIKAGVTKKRFQANPEKYL